MSDFGGLWSYGRMKRSVDGKAYWKWMDQNNKQAQSLINLKYKFNLNFMKLPSIYIDLCF